MNKEGEKNGDEGLGKRWKCGVGEVVWAQEGEWYLVCRECGVPN